VNENQAVAHFLETGTTEAFCLMFGAVYNRVRRYFVCCGLDEMTAEELAQNVLLKVYQHARELKEHSAFDAWLFRIARNELVSYHRKLAARLETIEFDGLELSQLDSLLFYQHSLYSNEVLDWLAAIAPHDREILVLRFVEGLSYEELATVLALPVGTVKSRLFAARKRLAMVMELHKPLPQRAEKQLTPG
jgi:RNA polymerase sigma-70 factor (ECF subfamily)